MDFHATIFALPAVKRALADGVLSANLSHREARFLLLQDADDLRFIEPLLLHLVSSFEILGENLTL